MPTQLSLERTIHAAPQTVFAVQSDISNWADLVPAITKVEMLTDGPVQVGTRFRETRVMFGKEATEEMEIVEFNAPTNYVLHAESHGSKYRSEFRFEPAPDGTKLIFNFEAEPQTTFAKVMGFLMKPMMKKMLDLCGKDLDAVKAHIEALESA